MKLHEATQMVQVCRKMLKPKTIKNYEALMKKLITTAETEEKNDCVTLLVNTAARINDINKLPITTRCSAYTSVLVYCDIFKGNEALYKKIHEKYLEQKIIAQASYTKEKSKQVKTEKEEEKWTDMKNLHQARLGWEVLAKTTKDEKKKIKVAKNWLISSLYTLIPPRRNEYRSLWFFRISDSAEGLQQFKNYKKVHKQQNLNAIYRFPTSPPTYKMVLREYKTHSSYGDFEMLIDEEHPLYQPFTLYADVSKVGINVLEEEWTEPYLFPNAKKFIMNTASWGRLLNSVFKSTGKKISSTMLRHIYISDKFKGDTPLQVRKDLAKMMGHKPTTAQMVYEKKD